ncbi:unnamed protein product [Cunninghamella blakesleeana]
MSFVQQRERRANAGNRMRALLDKEMDMEELFELDESEDESFSEMEQDEPQDTVDSDFDLDESEGEDEQEKLAEEEEKQLRKEEKQTKKSSKQQQYLQKSSSSSLNNKKVLKPTTTTQHTKRKDTSQSLDLNLNNSGSSSNRQSLRTRTVLNRILVEEQIRENEERRALIPKRFRPAVKRFTQEELLAEAAITEEENRASLHQWQQKEAERQAKSKIQVKRGIEGPFVRYHSFTDGTIDDRPKPRKLIMLMDEDVDKDNENNDDKDSHPITTAKQVEITDPTALEHQYQLDVLHSNVESRTLITFITSDDDINNYRKQLEINSNENNNNGNDNGNNEDHQHNNGGDISDTSKNKLSHIRTNGLTDREIDKLDMIPTLEYWTEKSPRIVKPLSCPITGKEAIYRDPISATPFATKTAYQAINDCLHHKYIWSSSLGIYIGKEDGIDSASGVLDGWDKILKGKKEGTKDWDGDTYPSWLKIENMEEDDSMDVDDQQ